MKNNISNNQIYFPPLGIKFIKHSLRRGVVLIILQILAYGITISFPIITSASVPNEKFQRGTTTIETANCDQSITTVLNAIAAKEGIYFERIFGQYRMGQLLIFMNRNSKELSFSEAENIPKEILGVIKETYPLVSGEVELIGKNDAWDFIKINFSNGRMVKQNIAPDRNIIDERVRARSLPPEEKFGLSEDQRKMFVTERSKLSAWADNEAIKKYPNPWDDNQREYGDQLFYLKYSELLKKYRLTEDQARDILLNEATQKGWGE
ncbi:MAG: hypothetical protein Q8Q08_06595 [Candidatus Omnitrophota bacterium]|nr:hypothetical protein [Candidatus Omnitrophota bacterium]